MKTANSITTNLKLIFSSILSCRYVSVGDIVHVGTHAPSVAAVYRNSDNNFALPIGFDLVRYEAAKILLSYFSLHGVNCHTYDLKSGMEKLCRGLQCPPNYLATTCSGWVCGNWVCGCGCF